MTRRSDEVRPRSRLPEGEVTLLFTDIEGSTRLLHEIGDLFGEVSEDHDRVLVRVWERFGGAVVKTEGDAFFVAFSDAGAGVAAAAEAQRALAAHRWPHGASPRVRIGVHTGSPRVRGQDYWGIDVHYAARLCACASGGQVLVSAATRARVPEIAVDDLGEHALKDFPAPRRLFHLKVDGSEASEFPAPHTADRARSNLPSPPNRLIGREREVSEIRDALTGDVRLLTITGVGGAGKTRLAIACGSDLVNSFPGGVLFASLATVTDATVAPSAIAYAIGVPVEDDHDAQRAIVEHLAGRRVLLIVDNIEHLLGAVPLLSALLEQLPEIRLLVTSQTPLRLRSEVVMPLSSLELPADPDAGLEVVETTPAVALFLERVRAADPAFRLPPDQSRLVTALCRRLDGLPLALELAAARVRLLGLERLLAALDRGPAALGTGHRDLPERQRGLSVALDYTVSLLEERPRRLFSGLGAFADAWTVEQAEWMFGQELDVWDAAMALLDFSLIRKRGDGRLTMAEPVRSYARTMLASSGREEEYRRRHALMLAEEAETIHDQVLFEMRLLARVIELGREFAAAVLWTRERDREIHRRLVAALGMTYYLTGRLSLIAEDIVAWTIKDTARDTVTARLHIAHAAVLVTTGDIDSAFDTAGIAAERQRSLGNQRGEAFALAIQAQILNQAQAGDRRVTELVERGLALPSAQRDPLVRSLLLGQLGVNHLWLGRIDDAERLLSELLADGRLADSFIAEVAMESVGACALERGDFDAALHRYARSLRRTNNQPMATLLQCAGIASALAGLGHDDAAIEVLAGAEAVAGREGLGSISEEWFSPTQKRLFHRSQARLGGSDSAKAQRRGQHYDYRKVVERALAVADEHTHAEAGAA